MEYDFEDPNFDFAGNAEIIAAKLRKAREMQNTEAPQGIRAGNVFAMSQPDIGGAIQRGVGRYEQAQAEQARGSMNTEQLRRYDELSRGLNEMKPVDYSNPDEALLENSRRQALAGQMSKLNLPMAQKTAEIYMNKGASFPETIAKMRMEQVERGEQNALRLKEIEAQKARDAAAAFERDRARAQDKKDMMMFAASLKGSGGPKADMRIVDTVDADGNPVKQIIDLSQMKPGDTLGKPADSATKKAIIEGRIGAAGIDRAIELIDAKPNSVGPQYKIPGAELAGQYLDPEGVPARASVANVGSLKLHDRSGAAVTISEFPRLAPFIPTAGDSPAAAKAKLKGLKAEYEVIQKEWKSGINGDLLGGAPKPAAKPEGAGLTVVRTGTRNGKRVQQMFDGSIREVE